MAIAHSTGKGRSHRIRPSKTGPVARHRGYLTQQDEEKSDAPERRTAIRIRGPLRQFLESEQGFLLKAESLLLCIAKSMDDGAHPIAGPYYPDVVALAADLIKRRADNIDQLLLDGRLPERPGP